MGIGSARIPEMTQILSTGDVFVSADLFGPPSPKNTERVNSLKEQLQIVINDAESTPEVASALGTTKILIVSESDQGGAVTRDIAQKVLDSTDSTTVLVQTSSHSDTVSKNLSRASIEKNAPILHGQEDVSATGRYLEAISHQQSDIPVNAGSFITVLVTVIISIWAARKTF